MTFIGNCVCGRKIYTEKELPAAKPKSEPKSTSTFDSDDGWDFTPPTTPSVYDKPKKAKKGKYDKFYDAQMTAPLLPDDSDDGYYIPTTDTPKPKPKVHFAKNDTDDDDVWVPTPKRRKGPVKSKPKPKPKPKPIPKPRSNYTTKTNKTTTSYNNDGDDWGPMTFASDDKPEYKKSTLYYV